MESRIKESIIKHLEYQKSIAKDPEGPFICCPMPGKNSWTISEIIEEVRKVDIKSCQNNFDEMLQEIYKNLKIKDNAKDMKDTIIDLLKIIIIKEKIEEHQMEMRNKNLYLNRGMRGYNPYIEF